MEFKKECDVMVRAKEFKKYGGCPRDSITEIYESGRAAMSISDLMTYRVDGNTDTQIFRNNSFVCIDQFIRSPYDDSMKFIRSDHPYIKQIKSKLESSKIGFDGSLDLSCGEYESLVGDGVYDFNSKVVSDLRENNHSHTDLRYDFLVFALFDNVEMVNENIELQKNYGRKINSSFGIHPTRHPGIRLVGVGNIESLSSNLHGGAFRSAMSDYMVGIFRSDEN